MKAIIFLLFVFYSTESFSQFAFESDPHRGMYLDKFLKTPLNNSSVVDPAFSILSVDTNHDGIFEKEDLVLSYAAENHITYINLFDLHRILGHHLLAWDENLHRNADLEEHLTRFLKKAKSKYGITQIGAIGGSESFYDSLQAFLNRYPEADFDVVNTEYEFWNDCANDFPNYVSLLNSMYSMKEAYNLAHPTNKIISEAYLAAIQYCNGSFGTAPVVETIDGCTSCSPCAGCPNPQPRMADRILYAWFIIDPGSMNMAEQNAFELPLTEDSTDFHPILYSESYATGGIVDWTGVWFPLSSSNNIFTAEEIYYKTWRNNSGVAFGTPRQNHVVPGGVHWFASTFMAGHLDHPQVLQNTGPYCSTGQAVPVSFDYFGPIEPGINFQFWITRNSDNATVYPAAGGRLNGVSGNYQPQTPTTTLRKNINFSDTTIFPPCILIDGEYQAHLLLTYEEGTGQSFQCDNSLVVGTQPRLEVVGPSQFCEGDYTYLRTNATGGSITWYRNGIQIPGTSPDLLVKADGDYSCMISGGSGCSGMSDTIHIHVLSNPAIAVNAVCNGNVAILKTNLEPVDSTSASLSGIGGVLYRWNTGDSTSQITVTPTTTNTTYRVNVTNPYTGCMRTGQITLKTPFPQPYSSSISITTLPSSPCSADGKLTAFISAGGGPNSFLWSNGETTSMITNVAPGTYSVAMNVWGGGCTSYATINVGSLPGNSPVVQPVIQNASCAGFSDGNIQLNISGGNPPFRFNWNLFPDDSIHDPYVKNQSSLYAGNYSVRIIDSSGCNFDYSFDVGVDHASPSIVVSNINAVTGCASSLNGSATVQASGGTAPYTYLWNDTPQHTSQTVNTLPAGSTIVTVTDANGCKTSKYVEVRSIDLPMQLELLDSSRNVLSCPGAHDGSLYIKILEGNSPYQVSFPWSLSGNLAILTNQDSGIFPIQIIDSDSCIVSDTFHITTPETLQLFSVAVPTNCTGCQDGRILITYNGGIAPYHISWLPSNGNLTGNEIQNLPGGVYDVCLTDGNGCNICNQDTVREVNPGVNEFEINSFLNIYPNPYSDHTTISLVNKKIKSGKIIISSIDGKPVFSSQLNDNPLIILKNDLSPGMYFIRLIDEKNRLVNGVKKLIVIE